MKNQFHSKLFLGAVLSFFLQGCIHSEPSAQRQVASANLPRHVIIAVHGIGGGKDTWGSMGEVVTKHLAAINPNYQPEFYTFNYHMDEKEHLTNTWEYGEVLLSRFLENTVFKDRPLQPQDKISFVAHSQGGLVTSIWYVDTLLDSELKQEGLYKKDLAAMAKYADHVETIVTLGTPFWGSKIATQFTDAAKFDPSKPFNLFNPEEMNEMAFGSDTIYKFRRTTISLTGAKRIKERYKAHMVNIVGVYPQNEEKLYYKNAKNDDFFKISKAILRLIQDKFFKIGFGDDRYESDIAVLVPSGRMKFLYAEDLGKDDAQKKITGDSYKEADFYANNDWIVTESVHSPIFPSYNVGMAYIPKSCEELSNCVHPTYRYVLSALANCAHNQCDRQAEQATTDTLKRANAEDEEINKGLDENLKGFAVEVVLRMPNASYDLENPKFKKKIGVQFYTRNSLPSEAYVNDEWVFSQKRFFEECVRVPVNGADGNMTNSNPLVEVHLGDSKEYLSQVARWHDFKFKKSNHLDLRLHMTGFIRPSKAAKASPEAYDSYLELIKKGVDIPLEISMPGLEKRKITVRVRPAYSTFVEMQMHDLK
jgi:hypothetical protein